MRFNSEFRDRVKGGLGPEIETVGQLSDDVKAKLDSAIADFRKDFGAGE